ncbi:non-specific lipid transfer protein GPI-anchored 20 [Musa acuminata AAA Group]|uniref:non-specific lipid transfer protein GPI-anchored 20 n=1 Tax=Musa acuminata AAA Group TaxID=214697 RepID=UPI0031D9E56C
MEKAKRFVLLLAAVVAVRVVSGQITTACTAALISSFTPCLNYITGSTNGGGSPTEDCCKALGAVVGSSKDCACLILTGNVPFSLPINRTLSISLPKMCDSMSVPLECTGTSATLPTPGSPVANEPSLPPLPPFLPAPPPPPPQVALPPAASPVSTGTPADQGLNEGQRPLLLPSSAIKLTHRAFSIAVFTLPLLGTMLLE